MLIKTPVGVGNSRYCHVKVKVESLIFEQRIEKVKEQQYRKQ